MKSSEPIRAASKALESVAGRRLTYNELTDKQAFNWIVIIPLAHIGV